jgi:hypothetical protein
LGLIGKSTKKSKPCWKITRVCLPNMPLIKNQRHKKYLKAVFEKLALRTQNMCFPLVKT